MQVHETTKFDYWLLLFIYNTHFMFAYAINKCSGFTIISTHVGCKSTSTSSNRIAQRKGSESPGNTMTHLVVCLFLNRNSTDETSSYSTTVFLLSYTCLRSITWNCRISCIVSLITSITKPVSTNIFYGHFFTSSLPNICLRTIAKLPTFISSTSAHTNPTNKIMLYLVVKIFLQQTISEAFLRKFVVGIVLHQYGFGFIYFIVLAMHHHQKLAFLQRIMI